MATHHLPYFLNELISKEFEMLTQKRVKELFDYDEGNLIRKVQLSANAKVGDIAGTMTDNGYIVVNVDRHRYRSHRIVWLWHNGYMPENMLDHINRNRTDNRIENLREVSPQCNAINAKIADNNTSGIRGICWCKETHRWYAKIKINQKLHNLGRHICFTEAVAHRLAAEQCLKWGTCASDSSSYKYIEDYLIDNRSA